MVVSGTSTLRTISSNVVQHTVVVSGSSTLRTISSPIDSSISTSLASANSQVDTSGNIIGFSSSTTQENSTSAQPTPEKITATWTITANTTMVADLSSTTVTETFSAGTITSTWTTLKEPTHTEPSTLTKITTVTRTGYTRTRTGVYMTFKTTKTGTTYTSTYIYPSPSSSAMSNQSSTESSTRHRTLTKGEHSTSSRASHSHSHNHTKSLYTPSGSRALTPSGYHNRTSACSPCFTGTGTNITTSPKPTATSTPVESGSGSPAGKIAGAVIGVVLAVVLTGVAGWFAHKKWVKGGRNGEDEEEWWSQDRGAPGGQGQNALPDGLSGPIRRVNPGGTATRKLD